MLGTFIQMMGFVSCMLLSMEMAQASPPPCVLNPPDVNRSLAIQNADLIVVGEPVTNPPEMLHPYTSAPLATYEDVTVRQVLKGSYNKPTIRLVVNSGYTTDPIGFGLIKTKSIILIMQLKSPSTQEITPYPASNSACSESFIEVGDNKTAIQDFVKQYLTKK